MRTCWEAISCAQAWWFSNIHALVIWPIEPIGPIGPIGVDGPIVPGPVAVPVPVPAPVPVPRLWGCLILCAGMVNLKVREG